MTQQLINIGNAPGDNTGDPARTAFDKCNLNFTELYGRSASVSGFAEYKYDTTTTPPPASGYIRANNASVSAVTVLYFNNITSNGSDIKRVLTEMSVGTVMVIQDQDNNVNFGKFTVSATPIDQTSYVQFPVTVSDFGGTLFNNARLLVAVMGGGAGAGGNVNNVGTPTANQIAQWTDATHIQGITGTQTTAALDVFTSALKGLAPSSGGGTANFLRADGSWAAPPAGAVPVPTYQIFTSGSGTYTTPANCRQIEVTLVGGGGGGSGGGATGANGLNGGNTTFGTGPLFSAGGGSFGTGTTGPGGTGGTISGSGTPTWSVVGGSGNGGMTAAAGVNGIGGTGGVSTRGGGGAGGYVTSGGGYNATTNSGSGGGGGGNTATGASVGAGGGAGATIFAVINAPAATYPYAVGPGGGGGAPVGTGTVGGNGGSGIIIVKEVY